MALHQIWLKEKVCLKYELAFLNHRRSTRSYIEYPKMKVLGVWAKIVWYFGNRFIHGNLNEA